MFVERLLYQKGWRVFNFHLSLQSEIMNKENDLCRKSIYFHPLEGQTRFQISETVHFFIYAGYINLIKFIYFYRRKFMITILMIIAIFIVWKSWGNYCIMNLNIAEISDSMAFNESSSEGESNQIKEEVSIGTEQSGNITF